MSLNTSTSTRPPDELTEFAMDILGRSAVQLRLPCQHVAVTLEHLRKLRMVTERAIQILEAAPTKDDKTALSKSRACSEVWL